jgi:uncharacterized paraquat-inducible protein A
MSKFVFNCLECGKSISVDEQRVGETASCPRCGKPIIIPECATVGKRCYDKQPGLETTLRTLGGGLLVLSFLAAFAALVGCVAQQTIAWLPLAVGTVFAGFVEFYFFCWAGELLAAVKKMAGLGYDPHFKTYQDERSVDTCNMCWREVTNGDKICPNCQRPLVWPEQKT